MDGGEKGRKLRPFQQTGSDNGGAEVEVRGDLSSVGHGPGLLRCWCEEAAHVTRKRCLLLVGHAKVDLEDLGGTC